MSLRIMSQVWGLTLGNSAKKLVLLALADNANDEGECYPSLATIARKTDLDERTVRRAIRVLQEEGHLQTRARSGRSTVFRLTVTPDNNVTPDKNAVGTNLSPHPGLSVPPPRTLCPPTLDSVPPITSKEPIKEPSRNQKKAADAALLADARALSGLDVEAFDRYLAYRQAGGKPIKPPSLEWCARKLAKFGADQAAVVQQSIEESWSGLFAVRRDKPAQRAAPKSPYVAREFPS